MSVRLPTPGGDDGVWGDLLNSFLLTSHNPNGTLLSSSIQQAGGVTNDKIGAADGVASLDSTAKVPVGQLGNGSASNANFLRGDGTWSSAVPSVFGRSGPITAQSGDYTASQVGALPSTTDLSAIATANSTANDVSMNSHKITGLSNGSAATDAAAFGQIPTSSSSTPLANSTTAASAGSSANWSHSDHTHPRYDWTPGDNGLISWNFDPATMGTSSTALTPAGTMFVMRLHTPIATSVTNIITYVITSGSVLTSGQCFAALYQSGSLIGATADQSTAWASAGLKTMPLSGGPFNIAAGDVYVGFWYNGTTGPALGRGFSNSTSAINVGLSATSSRFGTANTSLTTTAPASLGAISAVNIAYWAAIS